MRQHATCCIVTLSLFHTNCSDSWKVWATKFFTVALERSWVVLPTCTPCASKCRTISVGHLVFFVETRPVSRRRDAPLLVTYLFRSILVVICKKRTLRVTRGAIASSADRTGPSRCYLSMDLSFCFFLFNLIIMYVYVILFRSVE